MELNQNDGRGEYRLPCDDHDWKKRDRVFISKKQMVCFVITVVVLVIISAVIGTVVSLKRESAITESEPFHASNRTRKTTGASTHTDELWKNYRLPRRILPEHYWLTLRINMSSDIFHGKVAILIRVYENTNIIILHTDPDNMQYSKIQLQTMSKSPVSVISTRSYGEYLIIEAEKQLTSGQSYMLTILFSAPFGSYPTNGLYKLGNEMIYDSEKQEWIEQKDMALTMLFPVHARRNFPCFDEPNMKAKFTLILLYNRGYKSLANMPLQVRRVSSHMNIDKFHTTPKMPTYLLNYVIFDYTWTSATKGDGKKIRLWSPKQKWRRRYLALTVANKTLERFEAFFGMKYPLPKLDMITAPSYTYKAMEHWGLINYIEDDVLFRETAPQEDMIARQSVALLVAHELAHQWIGNTVTIKWWNDLVIQEGVAEYLQYLGAAAALPSYQIMEQFYNIDLRDAMADDALRTAACIAKKVTSSQDAEHSVTSLVYTKGASIVRMLHHYIGDEAFQSGMRLYLKKYAYENVDREDFWDSFSQTSNIDVSSVMEGWALQPGFPVITASNIADGKVYLRQQRFTKGKRLPGEWRNTTWRVPITYVTSKDPKEVRRYILNSQNSTMSADGKWFKINVNASGYYIVNYGTENWLSLIEQLKENHTVFSALDRASIIKDAFTLVDERLLPTKVALGLTTYLHKEIDWIPWEYAKQYLAEMIVILPARSKLRKKLTTYFWNISRPVFEVVGWEEKYTLGERLLQGTLVNAALNAGDTNATAVSEKMFRDWIENNTHIPDNILQTVMHCGVTKGTIDDWAVVFRRKGFERRKHRKAALLNALGASRNTWALNRLLELSTMTRHISVTKSINAVADGSRLGRSVAWNFIKMNWQRLPFSTSAEYAVKSYVVHVVEKFSDTYHYNDVYRFLRNVFATEELPESAMEILAKIRRNILWVKTSSSEVEDWLENNTV